MPTLLPTGLAVTDLELAVLKHDMTDPEVWLKDALKNKIASCMSNLDTAYRATLETDPNVTVIPVSLYKRVEIILARSDYQDFATRTQNQGA